MKTAVLTGDIINSRDTNATNWISLIKEALNKFGSEPKNWEIFRGDSFQLEVNPEDALRAALYIKATIKQKKALDVRLSIGVGEKDYAAEKITESNGTAFINSGECFDQLKKQNLAIRTPWEKFDAEINQFLELALLIMDNWSSVTAQTIKVTLENPDLNQKALSEKLKKSQSNISEALKRGGFEEIINMEKRYRILLKQLL